MQEIQCNGNLLYKPPCSSFTQPTVLHQKRVQVPLIGILQDQGKVLVCKKHVIQADDVRVDELEMVFHLALGVLVVLATSDEFNGYLSALVVGVVGKDDPTKGALANVFDVHIARLAVYGTGGGACGGGCCRTAARCVAGLLWLLISVGGAAVFARGVVRDCRHGCRKAHAGGWHDRLVPGGCVVGDGGWMPDRKLGTIGAVRCWQGEYRC